MGENTIADCKKKVVKLTPGSKIYKLFSYKEVIVEGSREKFIIRIEKIPKKT